MTRKEIAALLRRHEQSFSKLGDEHIQELQTHSYRILGGARSAFVKWFPKGNRRGQTELEYYESVLSGCGLPTPELLHTVSTDEGILGIWEWLEGSDLRNTHRFLLPQAFALLGKFHAAHRHHGLVESPITSRQYRSISELVVDELDLLWLFDDASARTRCLDMLSVLKRGHATVNHGDVHPGNIIHARDSLFFVDWGYAHRGVGLTDLAYLWNTHIHADCIQAWWMISGDEAMECADAYLRAASLREVSASEVLHSVMIWSQLCTHSNAVRNGLAGDATECQKLILELLD